MDANLEPWVSIALTHFESHVLLRPGDFTLNLELARLTIRSHTLPPYPEIVSSVSHKDLNKPVLAFTLKHFSKKAPHYVDVDFDIDAQVGSVYGNFIPTLVHEMLVYVANTEVNKLRYHRPQSIMPAA